MSTPLKKLTDHGVAVWLDDLSRDSLADGTLAERIASFSTTGVTTNPTIFARSISSGEQYRQAVRALSSQDVGADEALRLLTTADVRLAADLLAPIYQATGGEDGFVSIEVDPALAHNPIGTVAAARTMHWMVDRPNVMVKIPATRDALPAITRCLADGISVNATLLFSKTRFVEVLGASIAGMEKAAAAGIDLNTVRAVGSFFVSRIDTAVDAELEARNVARTDPAYGSAGIASALVAYEAYLDRLESPKVKSLNEGGGALMRPLWASTGTKNPDYSDTMYVDRLVTPGAVNTMPAGTLDAFADHGNPQPATSAANLSAAHAALHAIGEHQVNLDAITSRLEHAGVSAFQESWEELSRNMRVELARARNVDY